MRFAGRFVNEVCGGSTSLPPPPPPQAVSVGATEFGRGVRVVTEKSTLELFVSSEASSRVWQPGAMLLVSELPAGIAGAGEPTGSPAALPLLSKPPQETQSISDSSKQIAPP